MSAPDVLFLCARNAVRSPMAEALFNHKTGGGAISCGVAPAGFPDGHMVAVMAELGLDLSEFECKGLDSVANHPTRMVCLTDELSAVAEEIAASWGIPLETWNIPDPALEAGPRDIRLSAYRTARETIEGRISTLLAATGEA